MSLANPSITDLSTVDLQYILRNGASDKLLPILQELNKRHNLDSNTLFCVNLEGRDKNFLKLYYQIALRHKKEISTKLLLQIIENPYYQTLAKRAEKILVKDSRVSKENLLLILKKGKNQEAVAIARQKLKDQCAKKENKTELMELIGQDQNAECALETLEEFLISNPKKHSLINLLEEELYFFSVTIISRIIQYLENCSDAMTHADFYRLILRSAYDSIRIWAFEEFLKAPPTALELKDIIERDNIGEDIALRALEIYKDLPEASYDTLKSIRTNCYNGKIVDRINEIFSTPYYILMRSLLPALT